MEKTFKLAVVIPTFNRVEKLKYALSKIEEQVVNADVELHCVISNTASTDATDVYLNELKSTANVKYHILNKPGKNIHINWLRCVEFIPEEIDWIWFHGDDDYFVRDDAIQIVVNQILDTKNELVTLIHACQARRSRGTENVYRGTLLGLCNSIGYHEMLGWMSSLVVRKDRFVLGMKKALNKTDQIKNLEDIFKLKISAFAHSAGLLEACISDESLFIDMPLIDPQDQEQTQESIQRWTDEKIGERYFFVIDDLVKLKEKNILKDELTCVFFRYLNYSLWDRFSANIIGTVVNNGVVTNADRENLERIKQISYFLKNAFEKKIFLQNYKLLEDCINNYELSIKIIQNQRNQLANHYALTNTACYPFEVLNADGSLPGISAS